MNIHSWAALVCFVLLPMLTAAFVLGRRYERLIHERRRDERRWIKVRSRREKYANRLKNKLGEYLDNLCWTWDVEVCYGTSGLIEVVMFDQLNRWPTKSGEETARLGVIAVNYSDEYGLKTELANPLTGEQVSFGDERDFDKLIFSAKELLVGQVSLFHHHPEKGTSVYG